MKAITLHGPGDVVPDPRIEALTLAHRLLP